MRVRIDRRRLPLLLAAAAASLAAAGFGAARAGRDALSGALVACRDMLIVFGGELTAETVLSIGLAALLLTGVLYAVFGGLAEVLRVRRLERRARTGARPAGRRRVFLTTGLPHPAWTVGILRPRVYVASEVWTVLAEGEREALLAHERSHIRHHDILKRVLGDAVRRLFWFVPTVGDAVGVLRLGQEIRADRDALSRAGLRSLCTLYLSTSTACGPVHAAGFAFSSPRLAEVLDARPPFADFSMRRLAVSAAMAGIVLFGGWGGFMGRAHAAEPPTCEAIETMAPQSFTSLVGPLELYTPAPENACSQDLAC